MLTKKIIGTTIGLSMLALAACNTQSSGSKPQISSTARIVEKAYNLESILTTEEQTTLEKIQAAKKFGEQLGLKPSGTFLKLDLSEKSRYFYGVTASFPDKIKPIFEGLDFKFFGTDKSAALRLGNKLGSEGYHVHVMQFEAYGGGMPSYGSFGGKVPSPVTRSLLESDLIWAVSVAIHEEVHNHFVTSGIKVPRYLEESIAAYIGFKATVDFFKGRDKQDYEKAKFLFEEEWRDTVKFINKYYQKLSKCYQDRGDCQSILNKANEENDQYKEGGCVSIPEIGSCRVNNASLLRMLPYTLNYDLVFKTLSKVSIKEYLANPHPINKKLVSQMTYLNN